MPKRKNNPNAISPGTMVEQKRFTDYNNRKPSLSDPNELESKVNAENITVTAKTKRVSPNRKNVKPV
jgi:hypothetical protein